MVEHVKNKTKQKMAEGGSHEAEERKSHKKINQTNEKINKERKNQKYFSPQKKINNKY